MILKTAPGISDFSIGSINIFSLSSILSLGSTSTLSILHDDDLLNELDDGDNSNGRFFDLPPTSSGRWIFKHFGSETAAFSLACWFACGCFCWFKWLWLLLLLTFFPVASWWNDTDSRLCDDRTHVRNTNTVSFEPNGPPVIHGLSFWLDDLSGFLLALEKLHSVSWIN